MLRFTRIEISADYTRFCVWCQNEKLAKMIGLVKFFYFYRNRPAAPMRVTIPAIGKLVFLVPSVVAPP